MSWFKKHWKTIRTVAEILSGTYFFFEVNKRVGFSAVWKKLNTTPKLPGLPAVRGEESSPTYSWDGIKTTFGPGLPVPFVYGRHAVGGTVIYTDVFATTVAGAIDDELRIVLALSEGPIHRIGDLSAAEVDRLGAIGTSLPPGPPIPDHIRINDNLLDHTAAVPGARVYLRPGTLDQRALPSNPFRGVTSVDSPSGRLDEANDTIIVTSVGDDLLTTVGFVFSFPSGLYAQDPQGNQSAYPVTLALSWRPQGATTWRNFYQVNQPSLLLPPVVMGGSGPRTDPLLFTIGANLGQQGAPGQAQPIEVRVVRQTASGGGTGGAVSNCQWRNVSYNADHILQYPRVALLGLELAAGARFAGGLPNITVRLDGLQVRVWDAVNGFSPRCWDVPAAPFDFGTRPPGRNNAWIALDFATADWGLGKWLGGNGEGLDLPSFRRWAAFCDTDPSPLDPWNEAGFCCDLVGDTPKPAWDWFLTILSTGRAAPVYRNGKLGVAYQYRDAHGDAGISVPAKVATQLFTSGNVEDLEVTWLSKGDRSTTLIYQYLDEDKLYAQTQLSVPDIEAGTNDPAALRTEQARAETNQAFGVVRRAQLWRQGIFDHRANRLLRRQVAFKTGRWADGAEVGDLFELEHELLRPFGAAVPISGLVLVGGTAVSEVSIDHAPPGSGSIVIRGPDGAPILRTFVDAEPVSGFAVSLSAPVTVGNGAACVLSDTGNLTETYQVVSIGREVDGKRQIIALQWVPEVFDPVTRADYDEGVSTDDDLGPPPPEQRLGAPQASDVQVVPRRDGSSAIRWTRPANRGGARARVFVRDHAGGAWLLAGETADSELVWRGFTPARTYDVSVCLEGPSGDGPGPDAGTIASFTAEEFPPFAPPPITNARASLLDEFLLLQWDDQDQRDLAYYEVRVGSCWASAPVLWRERAPRALLAHPPGAALPLLIAARSSGGLYGQPVKLIPPSWAPPSRVQVASLDDFATSPGGTHTGTQWNSGGHYIELQAGVLSGTYESPVLDVGYQGPIYWQVAIDREEHDGALIGDLHFPIGGGESRWRTVTTRPASPARPGSDWQTKISDLHMPIGDMPKTLRLGGNVGEVGSHTRVFVESKFEFNGSFGSYVEHSDRVVVARKMQVRLTFSRRKAAFSARATALKLYGYV